MSVWIADVTRDSFERGCDFARSTGCPRRGTFNIDIAASRMGRLIDRLAVGLLRSGSTVVAHLGDNGDCNLFRKYRGDIQTDRHAYSFKAVAWDAFALEMLDNRADLPLAADHPDVAGVRLHGPSQHVF